MLDYFNFNVRYGIILASKVFMIASTCYATNRPKLQNTSWKDSLFSWQDKLAGNYKTTNKNRRAVRFGLFLGRLLLNRTSQRCWPKNYLSECLMIYLIRAKGFLDTDIFPTYLAYFQKYTNLPIALEVLIVNVGVCSASSSCFRSFKLVSLEMDCERLLHDLWL